MSNSIKAAISILAILLLMLPLSSNLQEAGIDPAQTIRVFHIDGAIGPATSDYLQNGIAAANQKGEYMVIITMDTPGGLDLSMRDIIQAILESDIPVATFVFPQGSRAASAGTYILYASHIAAMAPATNLGAATPVQIGMPSMPGGSEPGDTEPENLSGGDAMEKKIINDATAYIRGLAEVHDRNAEWAVAAVEDAATLSANEALEMNVIDLVAENIDDLLRQIDGRTVLIHDDPVVLDTSEKIVVEDVPGWRTEFLRVITDPNLILILGMLGAYGIIIEFYNPGFGFAGITGAICLLLAAYGLQLLPINYVGLGLILFGLILIISEAFVPSFGILGIGGVISFVIGSIILVDSDSSVYRVSMPLIAAFATACALLLVITLRIFLRIHRKAAVSGIEQFIGQTGISIDEFSDSGMVKVGGELWKARTDTPLGKGDPVKITKVNGLELEVTRA